jgi:hypothetical protein
LWKSSLDLQLCAAKEMHKVSRTQKEIFGVPLLQCHVGVMDCWLKSWASRRGWWISGFIGLLLLILVQMVDVPVFVSTNKADWSRFSLRQNQLEARLAGSLFTAAPSSAAVGLPVSNQTLVGNGGFNHVDNLYFYNGEFILVGSAADFQMGLFAGEREGSSDVYSVVVKSEQEAQHFFRGRPVIWIPETTLLFFEYLEKKTCSFMDHYYHFMEYLEGIYYIYTAYGAGHVSMVLFPDCTNQEWVGKEPQKLNQLVLQALFPTAIQAGPPFLDGVPNQVLHFERVVSGDRAGAHQTQSVGRVSPSHHQFALSISCSAAGHTLQDLASATVSVKI